MTVIAGNELIWTIREFDNGLNDNLGEVLAQAVITGNESNVL